MKKILVFFMLFMFPFIVSAESVYKEVKNIDELVGTQKLVFVVDGNTFEFVDILKDPDTKNVDVQDGYLITNVGVNNIFNIASEDSSLSGDTLKIKPLVIGDLSVTCSKNKSCSKGNLYLKDDMFHYQDKEIKIQEISEGLFSVRSDNTHYLNYEDGNWVVSSNVQGIKIYHEVDEDVSSENNNQEIDNEYYMDDILIIGQTSRDSSKEKNESFINIHLYYDKEEVKTTKLNFKYENSNTVDVKIKFKDKYVDDKYYEYLMNDEYLSSDYLLTRVYVSQDSSYSMITNNGVNMSGGVLDNVLGGSNMYIYVSSKYSTQYYKDSELLDIGSDNKYYINPDSYSVPDEYINAVDSKILESVNYVDPLDVENFIYNIDLNDYQSSIKLPDNDYNYPWYINGKLVNSEFDIATNLDEAENKIFKFVFYTKVENPNTKDNKILVLIIFFSIILIIYMLWRRYEKSY